MSLVPKVRKIASPDEIKLIEQLAKEDNDDGCFLPTHAVEKGGEIVGCVSMAVLPVLMNWHHSRKVNARDSIMLKHTYDAMMEDRGLKRYAILCNKQSPYNAHMKALGFRSIWETEIFINV